MQPVKVRPSEELKARLNLKIANRLHLVKWRVRGQRQEIDPDEQRQQKVEGRKTD